MNKKAEKTLYISLQGAKNKDFHVRGLERGRLMPEVQQRDYDFAIDMYNIGDAENLPESDRLMICQQKGIKQTHCNK